MKNKMTILRDEMNEKISRNELLDKYIKLDNIKETFDTDILILPAYISSDRLSEDSFSDQPPRKDIINKLEKIKVKYYIQTADIHHEYNEDPSYVQLDTIVILTPKNMDTILKYIKELYPSIPVKGELYIVDKNGLFSGIAYYGIVSEIESAIRKTLRT
jgi:hypothetical protein